MSFVHKNWIDEASPLGPPANPANATPITSASLDDLEQRLANYTDARVAAISFAADATLWPSGDTTGATDDSNFSTAVGALPHGGVIRLMAQFDKPFYTATGWTLPAQTSSGYTGGGPVCLQGVGWPILQPVGAAVTALHYHRTSSYGNPEPPPLLTPAGVIDNLVIDGTRATGASRGLDIGDGMGYRVRGVVVKNFVGSGARGVNFNNTNLGGNHFFCEKSRFDVFCVNNYDNVYITAGSGSSSWEYNKFDVMVIALEDQRAVVIDNAALGGCELSIMGNMDSTSGVSTPTRNCAMISFLNGGKIWNGRVWAKIERSGGTGAFPYSLYGDGSDDSGIHQCSGQITTGLNGSKMQGAECSFSGEWDTSDDLPPPKNSPYGAGSYTHASLSYSAIPFPGWGNDFKNYGPDVLIAVSGAGVSGIHVEGITTGLTQGMFLVPSRSTFTVFGSGGDPNWVVMPARRGTL